MRVVIIRHPLSGERYAARLGREPRGGEYIHDVAGPLQGDDGLEAAAATLANMSGFDLEFDAKWLATELARSAGVTRKEIYGDTLAGILRDLQVA